MEHKRKNHKFFFFYINTVFLLCPESGHVKCACILKKKYPARFIECFLDMPVLRIRFGKNDMSHYTVKERYTVECLECGNEIKYGRSDRKFCCDKCKNLYHNRMTHQRRSVQLRVLGALEKNYEILSRLLSAEITSVSIGDLSQTGFNKEIMTSYHKVGSHDEFRCYDIKYYCSATRIFNIERVDMNY